MASLVYEREIGSGQAATEFNLAAHQSPRGFAVKTKHSTGSSPPRSPSRNLASYRKLSLCRSWWCQKYVLTEKKLCVFVFFPFFKLSTVSWLSSPLHCCASRPIFASDVENNSKSSYLLLRRMGDESWSLAVRVFGKRHAADLKARENSGRKSTLASLLEDIQKGLRGARVGRYTLFKSKKHASCNNKQLVSIEGVFVQT